MGPKRQALVKQIDNTFADGGTALYDAIAAAYQKLELFTVAYGASADPKVLQSIAEDGGGASFSGDPATIRQVYRDLAAFF